MTAVHDFHPVNLLHARNRERVVQAADNCPSDGNSNLLRLLLLGGVDEDTLTLAAHNLVGRAKDLGYNGPPFAFDPDRRAVLDVYYARLCHLTLEELRYILDPAVMIGIDYPSETFRVLKNGELREFGECRTQRRVLHAWDRLDLGDLH